jgi:hypothetical protein
LPETDSFQILEPEEVGGWRPGTHADTAIHFSVVHPLVYQVDAWLGDDVLVAFRCFVVTDRLARAIRAK